MRARENARRSACQSNLKQIGLGLIQYAQDYDETLPTMLNSIAGIPNTTLPSSTLKHYTSPVNSTFQYATSPYPNWIAATYPYVKNWQVFHCPSAVTGAYTGSLAGYASSGDSDASYLVNGVLIQRRLSAMARPASLIWAHEFRNRWNIAVVRPVAGSSPTLPVASNVAYNSWLESANLPLHLEGNNFLFCDGHVKWRRIEGVGAREFGLDSTITGARPTGSVSALADPDEVG